MKLLSVNHLSKRYPGFALQQVSFSVYPGRIMGLIGKNGAGKSTTLKSILNMVHPDSGDVKMFGMDFYQHEKECKQQIGVVFGGVDFYPLKKLSSITAVFLPPVPPRRPCRPILTAPPHIPTCSFFWYSFCR